MEELTVVSTRIKTIHCMWGGALKKISFRVRVCFKKMMSRASINAGPHISTLQDSENMSLAKADSKKNGELGARHKRERESLVGLSDFVLLNTGSRTSCRREISCILLTINSQDLKPVNAVLNWWKLFCVERWRWMKIADLLQWNPGVNRIQSL